MPDSITANSAGGYTTATTAGSLFGFSSAHPVSSGDSSNSAASVGYNGPLASTRFLGQPFAFWLGIIFALFLLKVVGEKFPNNGLQLGDTRISWYNFLVIGFSAFIFIILFKLAANAVYIPGLTDLANAG